MIPLRDANPSSTQPVVTISLIAINAAVFLYQASLSKGGYDEFISVMGMVPERVAVFVTNPNVTLPQAFFPFLSSMFLHGGWGHLLGNMWFLWIFGDNVEDHLGRGRYLGFYLLCGLGAGMTHLAFNWGSLAPVIGASGAVAGVLGAYLLLYPRARVLTFIFIFVIELPASVVLVYWFVIQFVSGAATTMGGPEGGGGVAWWAHVGGFALGMVLIKLFPPRQGPGGVSYRIVN